MACGPEPQGWLWPLAERCWTPLARALGLHLWAVQEEGGRRHELSTPTVVPMLSHEERMPAGTLPGCGTHILHRGC